MARKNAAPIILENARTCLIAGKGDFEMSEVARKSGVSEGLAYHYFKSKAGLLTALIEDFYDRYKAVANERFDGDIPWAKREKQRLTNLIAFLYDDPLAPILLGVISRTPEAAAAETRCLHETVRLSAVNLSDGIKRGQISADIDPEIVGAAIIGAINQAVSFAMMSDSRPKEHALVEQLWALIMAIVMDEGPKRETRMD